MQPAFRAIGSGCAPTKLRHNRQTTKVSAEKIRTSGVTPLTCTGFGRCSFGVKRTWGVAEMDSKNAEVVISFVEVIIIFTKVIIIFVEAIIIFVKVIIIFVEVPSSGVEMVIIFAEMVINIVEVSTA